jgi:ketol-acid reductoisomerase
MYLKLHQADDEKAGIEQNMANISQSASKNNQPQPKPTESQPKSNIIQEYFSRVNNGQFSSLVALQDGSFRTLATLRNYFNTSRLETFAKNTV